MISVFFQGNHSTVIQVQAPTTDVIKIDVGWFCEDLQHFLELTTKKKKKKVLLIIGNWNSIIRSEEIPRIVGMLGFGVHKEEGQKLMEFCQKNILVASNHPFPTIKQMTIHGHHQVISAKI